MELEKQVCSLESANRLKELGVKQNSYWYWRDNKGVPKGIPFGLINMPRGGKKGDVSAFTVAELGEMLPICISGPRVLVMGKPLGDYKVQYRGDARSTIESCETNEAEARAKMLIYLLENKLMEITK